MECDVSNGHRLDIGLQMGVNLLQFLDRHVRSDATTPECYISGPIYCFQQEHAGAGKTQGVRRTLRDLLKPRVPLLRVVRN